VHIVKNAVQAESADILIEPEPRGDAKLLPLRHRVPLLAGQSDQTEARTIPLARLTHPIAVTGEGPNQPIVRLDARPQVLRLPDHPAVEQDALIAQRPHRAHVVTDEEHGPAGEEDRRAREAKREVTVLLVQYASPLAAATLPRSINSQSELQAASPAYETARPWAQRRPAVG